MAESMGPQPMGRGPGGGPWTDEDEKNFQTYMAFDPGVRAWRQGFVNKFGEQPDTTNDPTFDYRLAYRSGDGPRAYAHDTMPHWGSTGKAANHPTEWMNEFMQRFGVDPNDVAPDQWTPQMQAFMQQQIPRGVGSYREGGMAKKPVPRVRDNLPEDPNDEGSDSGLLKTLPTPYGTKVDSWETRTSVPPPIDQWRTPPRPPDVKGATDVRDFPRGGMASGAAVGSRATQPYPVPAQGSADEEPPHNDAEVIVRGLISGNAQLPELSGLTTGLGDARTPELPPAKMGQPEPRNVALSAGLPPQLEGAVPPPSQPTGPPANVQLRARGVGDRSRQASFERNIPRGEDTAPPGADRVPGRRLEDAVPSPSEPHGVPANVQLRARGVGDRSRQAAFEASLPPPQGPTPMPQLEDQVPPPEREYGPSPSTVYNVAGSVAREKAHSSLQRDAERAAAIRRRGFPPEPVGTSTTDIPYTGKSSDPNDQRWIGGPVNSRDLQVLSEKAGSNARAAGEFIDSLPLPLPEAIKRGDNSTGTKFPEPGSGSQVGPDRSGTPSLPSLPSAKALDASISPWATKSNVDPNDLSQVRQTASEMALARTPPKSPSSVSPSSPRPGGWDESMDPEGIAARAAAERARQPNQTPNGPVVPPVATPAVAASTNGPATRGNNTPGGFGNNQPAPPVGSGSANSPSTAPARTAPTTPPQTAPAVVPPPTPVGPASAPASASAAPQVALNVQPPPAPSAPSAAPPRPTPGVTPGAVPGAGSRGTGRLDDQSRTAAYNPEADANDPNNRILRYTGQTGAKPADNIVLGIDANGQTYGKTDLAQMIAGASTQARKNPDGSQTVVGSGSINPKTFDRYVEQKAGLLPGNVPFTKGEALLAGMVSDYRMLLAQGRVQQANSMAYGLIQAATLEAAASGRAAYDLWKAGDHRGALQKFVNGANLFPDGINLKLESDGRTITARDASGRVTAQTGVTPQQVLAGIMGLADGTLFWQSLHGAADQLNKDKNAEGRALANEIRKRQITLLDKKLAAPAKAGKPGPSAAATEFSRSIASISGKPQPQGDRVIVVNQGGDNDGELMRDPGGLE